MLQLNEVQTKAVLNLANEKSFFLKRKYDVKLDIAKEIRDSVGLRGSVTGKELVEWLEANKQAPSKPAKAAKQQTQPTFAGSAFASEQDRPIISGDRFLVTYAQNNTPVHSSFLDNLKAYAEHLDAQILVVKGHYNTEAFSGQCKGDSLIYDESIREYLVSEDQFLAYMRGVYLAAGVNILPTTALPVNAGKNIIGNSEAVIMGHTKQQAITLPRAKGHAAKWCYTTGTVTQRNYVQSAAGAKAEKDHAYGALLLEISDESLEWNVRQLRADEATGSFYDVKNFVSNATVYKTDTLSVVLGDIHAEKLDLGFWDKTLNWLADLQPEKVICHDILDFSSRNHHNRDSGHFLASQYGRKVLDDLETVSETLVELKDFSNCSDLIVVYSNHDDALLRWLDCNKYDPRKDVVNAPLYHQLNATVYKDILDNKAMSYPILETALAEMQLDSAQATFLTLDSSCSVYGVEVGQHGDKGINGSRGTPAQFAKMGVSAVTGHTHSPSLIGDVATVGCCNLDQGYNVGFSSWELCHCIIYPNGFKTLITL